MANEVQLNGVSHITDFILAGKAVFTVVSPKTGTRYTYKVRKADKGNLWFVNLLTGPDNLSDYTYLGVISNKAFKLTAKSKMPSTASPVVAFKWTVDHLFNGQDPHVEVWHAGHCGRCGKVLTVPQSIADGFGPECVQLVAATAHNKPALPVASTKPLFTGSLTNCSHCGEELPHCKCYWKAEYTKKEAAQEAAAFAAGLN